MVGLNSESWIYPILSEFFKIREHNVYEPQKREGPSEVRCYRRVYEIFYSIKLILYSKLLSCHSNYIVLFVIQSKYEVTRVYTPGYPGSPHLFPKETMPICVHLLASCSINGPPESPWHASVPPCAYPAQTKSDVIGWKYAWLQSSLRQMGNEACCWALLSLPP